MNKHEKFKNDYIAPKTLKQKWFYNEETKKFKSLGKTGVSLLNYTEIITNNSRTKFDINELVFE